jgi:hypothetical protein
MNGLKREKKLRKNLLLLEDKFYIPFLSSLFSDLDVFGGGGGGGGLAAEKISGTSAML